MSLRTTLTAPISIPLPAGVPMMGVMRFVNFIRASMRKELL